MSLIDTHSHLDFPDFQDDLDQVLLRAREKGVTRIITIGTGVESSHRAVELAAKHEGVYAAVGIHPSHADEARDDFEAVLRELACHPKVVAIGECGLDYHRLPANDDEGTDPLAALGAGTGMQAHADIVNGAYKATQARIFTAQLELAAGMGLNVIIHQREAWDDTLTLLRPFTGKLRGVFHCFGGTPDQAMEVIALGHLVSFTGIVTFKNAPGVREAAAMVSDDAFMVETDCPYLAPSPHRGSRCEPWHTALVAEKIAEVRGISPEEVAALTSHTAQKFFRFR